MEKGTRDSKNNRPTHVHDATSSRFFDNFQEMFHPDKDIPFVNRRALFENSQGSYKQPRVRLLCDEFILSSAKNESLKADGQHLGHERKFRELVYEGGNGGGIPDLKLSLPFSANTKSTEFSFPTKRKDIAGEIAAFESAVQAVAIKVNRENSSKTTIENHLENRDESTDEPGEKRRKQEFSEDDEADNVTRERESYWERRRKNNASAKKSRDARKARELQTQIRASFLERENLRILTQLMIVQQENACLKRVLYAKM